MNQIITHSNILNPHDLKVVTTTARHSSEIVKDLLIDDAYEVILSKNSIIQNEPFDIVEGDVINVMFVPKGGGGGGGNKITRTVMMLVVAVASAYTGFTVSAAYGSIWGAVAAGAVSIAGGLLVNAILPMATNTSSFNNSDFSTSTTYSWDESYNKFTQGAPVPKVFGTHKITPPLISKFIEPIDNKQYFNGLYALNDGVINGISDIKINDESIENFDNVSYEVRYGYNDQPAVSNFDNTRYDKSVGRKLDTSYTVTETSGNEVISLTATLLFPRGLFYANDSGAIVNYSVKVAMEYSSDGVNWSRFGGDTYTIGYWYYVNSAGIISKETNIHPYGTWIEYVSSLPANAVYHSAESSKYGTNYWYYEAWYSPYTTITASETSTFRKTFKVNNLPPAQYQVRARFYEAPQTSSRYGSDCYLEYITEEIGDDFTYPNTALLSIRALATDQLSGSSPKVSCIVSANSSNPATISKQMLLESGYTADRILPSLDTWETHCNNKGYTFNGVFDTSMTLRKALDLVGTVGRASVVQFGSKFEAIMDRAEEIPVQCFTFGMGNILKDSFKQTFLPILDRANVIEVTYYDANLNYEPTIVEVSSENYDSVSEENRTAITLVGCTNRALAIAHARYMLNCNRYLTETLEIEADKDSLVCKYGSIVKVSHDTPQYGFSGRIVSFTSTHVTLDREVTFESGKSYYIQIRDKHNNVKDHLVNNTNNTTDTLTFTSTVLDVYEEYDNYAFGEVGKASKLYRVLKISTSSDLTRKLTLLEYNEDVYNDSADIDIPIISDFGLRNLRATDYIRYAKDRTIETVMQLSWSGQSLKYVVDYQKEGSDIKKSITAHDNQIDIITSEGNYSISVTDGKSRISMNYTVVGKNAKPDPIEKLTGKENSGIFTLNWEYAFYPIDFYHFEVTRNGSQIDSTANTTLNYKFETYKTQVFGVCAVDTTGNKSNYSTIEIKPIDVPDITNLRQVRNDKRIALYWDNVIDNRSPIMYEVRYGTEWENGLITNITASTSFIPSTDGNYMVKAFYIYSDDTKKYSVNTSIISISGANMPDNILVSFDEKADLWNGNKTNLIINEDGNLEIATGNFDDIPDINSVTDLDAQSGVYSQGIYELLEPKTVDLGISQVCKLNVSYLANGKIKNNNVDNIFEFDKWEIIDGSTGAFDIRFQVSIADDTVFGEWKELTNSQYIGKKFKFRIILISKNPYTTCVLSKAIFTVDMADKILNGEETVAGAKTITYSSPFQIKPTPQITFKNQQSGDYYVLSGEDKTKFTIEVLNGGTHVTREIYWLSKGY